MNVRILYGCICLLTLASCIKNDVPYPYIPGNILEMTVEGQTGETEIDVAKNIVNITVDGNVDVDSLKVLKLKISDKAMMTPDSAACDIGSNRCPGRKSFLFSYSAVFVYGEKACFNCTKRSVPFETKPPYPETAEETLQTGT